MVIRKIGRIKRKIYNKRLETKNKNKKEVGGGGEGVANNVLTKGGCPFFLVVCHFEIQMSTFPVGSERV